MLLADGKTAGGAGKVGLGNGKGEVIFYLTSLGPNPSLNRHGYLHLCIFVTKK